MPVPETATATPRLVTGGRPARVAHLTTVDLSLHALLATELVVDVEAGCEVWGVSAPGPYVERVRSLGVQHAAVPSFDRSWRPANDARATRELAAVLRRVRPDVLHTHTPKAGVLGRLLGRALRVPVVVDTCHGLWTRPEQRSAVRRAVVTVEGVASRFAHAELYQNAEDRETLRRWVGQRGAVVGNGVDLTRFPGAGRARVRAELGVADDVLLVGGVGRMVREKGIEEYVETAQALAGRASFVWVGPEDDAKPDSLRSADVEGAVRFLGPRDDMADVYAALDVFVLPSWREGFSRSAMEAAATGLPMVLTDIRGCREIGTHGEHLLLVPASPAGGPHRRGVPAAGRPVAARAARGGGAGASAGRVRPAGGGPPVAGDLCRGRAPPGAAVEPGGAVVRRALDVAVAGLALLLLSPVLLVCLLVVRIALGSPVVFRQRRTGLTGREFTIYKLRTMRAERRPGEPDAERTGKVGAFLRGTSLDELPQLVNVLVGDMSLIGPRPTLPEQVAHYTPRQHRRHEVRPGITGWAQVNGRNSLSWPERIELDIWYIDHRSACVGRPHRRTDPAPPGAPLRCLRGGWRELRLSGLCGRPDQGQIDLLHPRRRPADVEVDRPSFRGL